MNETLKMELKEYIEMLRSDADIAKVSNTRIETIIRCYLSDIELIYKHAFGEF